MPENNKDKGNIIDSIFGKASEQQTLTSDAENAKLIIKEWLARTHIPYKTRYTKRQVRAVSILQSLANTYNIKPLKRYLTEFRIAKLSEESQSSKELENILKSRNIEPQESTLERLGKFLE
jgi:hypothetical protein